MIDFGLAKNYIDFETHQHIACQNKKQLNGTMRYASVSSLMGFEQSRKDDLESLAYNLVFFLKGCLPWQGLKENEKETQIEQILRMKKDISHEVLCSGLPGIHKKRNIFS